MNRPPTLASLPAHRVEGIVFEIALAIGVRVEVIGVPFAHRGRTFAVHPSTRSRAPTRVEYAVSDVETGQRIPRVAAATLDDARAEAMAVLDAVPEADWRKPFAAPAHRKPART
ncbi:hypothetical protein C6V06_05360 [Burkholderia gladioli]|nr:hypothetical protein [Burkholderia gladioli]MBU9276779.1 hypothetical protein [Burkholderia gladioli]PRE10671.1 hypothetical protein C6P72_34070 [Burkholderia gladioli]PRG56279.1 hypothetical protein C6V06_05360 [Burkholderia gladioli]